MGTPVPKRVVRMSCTTADCCGALWETKLYVKPYIKMSNMNLQCQRPQ